MGVSTTDAAGALKELIIRHGFYARKSPEDMRQLVKWAAEDLTRHGIEPADILEALAAYARQPWPLPRQGTRTLLSSSTLVELVTIWKDRQRKPPGHPEREAKDSHEATQTSLNVYYNEYKKAKIRKQPFDMPVGWICDLLKLNPEPYQTRAAQIIGAQPKANPLGVRNRESEDGKPRQSERLTAKARTLAVLDYFQKLAENGTSFIMLPKTTQE